MSFSVRCGSPSILPGFVLIALLAICNSAFSQSRRTNSRPTQPPSNTAAAPTTSQRSSSISLRYKLKAGEALHSRVSHFANTRTKIASLEEDSESRTVSEKVWHVKSVDPQGNMTFEYSIEAVDLAQRVGDQEEIKYNSRNDKDVPDAYRKVSQSLGKPLAVVTISPDGQVVKRNNESNAPQLGIGELTIPLPKEPVEIGGQWSTSRDCRAKLEDGTYKTIKLRDLYVLEKVSAGVATIRVSSQPLTPINDPAIDSQIVQQLSRGEIKFDIDNGRMISKQLDWKDVVVGFRGPETSLKYDARFVEELLPSSAQKTASQSQTKQRQ